MNTKSINLQRTESLLMELIPEALGSLENQLINALCITDVDCKNGKYDAKVYFDGSDYSKEELKEIQKALIKANGALKAYILSSTGWYKCPNFQFLVDDMMDKKMKIDALFAQIEKEKKL